MLSGVVNAALYTETSENVSCLCVVGLECGSVLTPLLSSQQPSIPCFRLVDNVQQFSIQRSSSILLITFSRMSIIYEDLFRISPTQHLHLNVPMFVFPEASTGTVESSEVLNTAHTCILKHRFDMSHVSCLPVHGMSPQPCSRGVNDWNFQYQYIDSSITIKVSSIPILQ